MKNIGRKVACAFSWVGAVSFGIGAIFVPPLGAISAAFIGSGIYFYKQAKKNNIKANDVTDIVQQITDTLNEDSENEDKPAMVVVHTSVFVVNNENAARAIIPYFNSSRDNTVVRRISAAELSNLDEAEHEVKTKPKQS